MAIRRAGEHASANGGGSPHVQVDEDNCVRGLVVVRGPGWDWGDQDGGDGHVGVVLRKLFVRNPCAPPMLQRAAGDGLDAIVDADDWQAQLGLERICLAQVRWATSGFVQTYRIGTYGRIEGIMTVSDLMMAAEQDHESVKPLRKMYEFRGRSETLEDIATLVIGDAIPSPVALEDILVRFFRPRPNAMALMDHVASILRDERLGVADRMTAHCDFCDLPLDPEQGMDAVAPACRSCQEGGHEWCACEAEGENDSDARTGVWATRLPCGHRFHRDCVRLCLMEDMGCPNGACGYHFSLEGVHLDEDDETVLGVRMPKERVGGQGRCQGGGGDNEEEGEVSGATLSFICDNERTWLRIALLVKFFAQTDNMSPMRGPRRDVGRAKEAAMCKERDVVTCVDLPQLEDKGWKVASAVMTMLIGVRSRDDLVCGADPDSTAVIDHILDTLSRDEEVLRDELEALSVKGRKEHAITDPTHSHLIKHLASIAASPSPPSAFASPPPAAPASAASASKFGASTRGGQIALIAPILKDVFGWEVSCIFQQHCLGEGDAERLLCGVPNTAPASPSPGILPTWASSASPPASGGTPVFKQASASPPTSGGTPVFKQLPPEGDAERLVARAMASPSASPSLRRRCGDGVRHFAELLVSASPQGSGVPPPLDLAAGGGVLGQGGTEGGHAGADGVVAVLRLAMIHIEVTGALYSSTQDSAVVAFRWLRNVATSLLEKDRLLIRPQDPFMVTVVAPNLGAQLALQALGFAQVSSTPRGGLTVGGGGLLAEQVDRQVARQFCSMLTERIGAPPSLRKAHSHQQQLAPSPSSGPPGCATGGGSSTEVTPSRIMSRPAGRSSLINETNLDLVCRWISSKIKEHPGEDEWSVLEVEVFPRLEDVGIGYEGSFGRALTRVLHGEREVDEITLGFDPATRTAVSRVLQCLLAHA